MHSKRMNLRGAGRWIVCTFVVFVLSCVICHAQAAGQRGESQPFGSVVHPAWSYAASIYEVNVRQYSPGGTFAEFEQHLPRLKELGVDILWFMPIHPIGETHRKGSLGSYYAVCDYRVVNPEFGTLDDFKRIVARAHDLDMYVIIDWVANHTAWDNPLTQSHPEWYTRDSLGRFVPPVPDWSDVIDLDYSHAGLRNYMLESMRYWVQAADLDGFRCDVAGMVPLEFWETARRELSDLKPVFLLAEDESPASHAFAFDMTYAWRLHHLMNAIVRGERTVSALDSQLAYDRSNYPRDAYRMQFTDNHDENSWNGTVFERLGDGAAAFAVLACTVPGMPLIYSGQEAGLDKRLAFFDRDPIVWREHPFAELYTTLLHMKKSNRALHNGIRGGDLQRVVTSADSAVFAFCRERDGDRILVILNLSPKAQTVRLDHAAGHWRDVFGNTDRRITAETELSLASWGYYVFVNP